MQWLGFETKLSAFAFQQSSIFTAPPIHFLVFFYKGELEENEIVLEDC